MIIIDSTFKTHYLIKNIPQLLLVLFISFPQTVLSHSAHNHHHDKPHSTTSTPNEEEPKAIQQARELQAEHQFADSQKILEHYIQTLDQTSKYYYQANSLLSSVALIQGNYPLAKSSCFKLLTHHNRLHAVNCSAAIGLVTGKAPATLRLLEQQFAMHNTTKNPDRITDTLRWSYGLAAELAWSLGKTSKAHKYFKIAAQQQTPNQKEYWTNAYLDFLIAEQAFDVVIDITRSPSASLAQKIRLAQAYKAIGDKQWKTLANSLNQRYEKMGADHPHWREVAMLALLLEHKNSVLLAKENWQQQKELIDAKIVLQAAIQQRKPQSAIDVVTWANTQHIEDQQTQGLINTLQATPTDVATKQ